MPAVYLKSLALKLYGQLPLFNSLIFRKWHLCLDFVFPASRGLVQITRKKRPLLAAKIRWAYFLGNFL